MKWLQEVVAGEIKLGPKKISMKHHTVQKIVWSVKSNFLKCVPSDLRVNCQCKYNFTDDGKKVTPRRDVPTYPKACPHVIYPGFIIKEQLLME